MMEWIRRLPWFARPARTKLPLRCHRPRVEALEDRWLPSTVTNLLDSGPGSLRDAIATTPANGTVTFQPGLTGTIHLTAASGTLDITKDLTIAGPGASAISVSGGNAVQVFTIAPNHTVSISGLTVRDGRGPHGGDIYNSGTLSVASSVITAGSTFDVGGGGGGLFNAGTLTLYNTTVSGNTSNGNGGGVFNAGSLTATNTTFAGNTAVDGGAVANSGTLTLINATVAGNDTVAGGSGGGLYLSANQAAVLVNTLVAGNTALAGPDITGTVTAADHDLIGNGSNSSGVVAGVSGNLVGTGSNPIDPRLGVLQNNGGPTPTRALLAGSPAIDAGTNTVGLTVDQRGFQRAVDGVIDIGAYEYQPPATAVALLVAPNPSTVNQPTALTATVSGVASGSNTPLGSVTFYDGGTPLATVPLNANGSALYATQAFLAGSHSLTASYSGFSVGDYQLASSNTPTPLVETINKEDTVTAVASSPNPASVGQPVTFTAFVSPYAPGPTLPTGTVTFYDNGNNLATVALSAADTGTYTTASLPAGTHSITAHYNGDSNFIVSTSVPRIQTINAYAAGVTLSSSPNPSRTGQPVTWQVTVRNTGGTGPVPTGTVSFLDGSSVVATSPLVNGSAVYTTATLTVGSHTITAHYNGDADFTPSTSTPLAQMVRYTLFAVGGAPGRVVVYKPDGTPLADFAPYGPSYTGPVSVAVGDVNGDGYLDLVTGALVGNPDVRVFDGKALATGTFNPNNPTASMLAGWFPYSINFNVGANVAVGDIEHDGYADIVTGASVGNPDVRVYSGRDITNHTFNPDGASMVAEWFPYGLGYNIGANVAVGDVNGDGYADVVTGATAGNPDVRVYSGRDIATHAFNPNGSSMMAQFFAYGLNFNVGAYVAVGDVSGDGYGDVITGASTGNPDVHVYDGRAIANHTFNGSHPEANQTTQFFAYDTGIGMGVSVGAADFEANGHFDILTGNTAGAGHYKVLRAGTTGVNPPGVMEGLPADLRSGLCVGA